MLKIADISVTNKLGKDAMKNILGGKKVSNPPTFRYVEDNQSLMQFKLQLATSDLQNAESVR